MLGKGIEERLRLVRFGERLGGVNGVGTASALVGTSGLKCHGGSEVFHKVT